MTKVCTKCKVEKEFDEFNTHRSSKDGLTNWCKDCCAVNTAVKRHQLGLGDTALSHSVRVKKMAATRKQSFIRDYGSDLVEVFDSMGWKP